MDHKILTDYNFLKESIRFAYLSVATSDKFNKIYADCLKFLESKKSYPLISKVTLKEYFAFSNGNKLSRAINKNLFKPNLEEWIAFVKNLREDKMSKYTSQQIQPILYSIAVSFCASLDLLKDGDQKTPGTFFEYLVAHLYSLRVGVEPQNYIQILNLDGKDTTLPTDLIFNLGPQQNKYHVPVKTSTRERSIMIWAHQKLIDGVYGVGNFLGTPVLLAETKTDKTKKKS